MSVARQDREEDHAMSIDLSPLLAKAFFVEELQNASEAIERALGTFEQRTHVGARPFEIASPPDPDEPWLREGLVHPLIYFCESEGTPLPRCSGVIVALFVGRTLYGIAAEEVIRWASELLGASVEQLHDQYGTREIETAL